jgi:hypothetical protein
VEVFLFYPTCGSPFFISDTWCFKSVKIHCKTKDIYDSSSKSCSRKNE